MNPLNPLYVAVAWVMAHIHTALSLIMPSTSGQAWFLTIVVLVVVMRLLLVPLFVKQMHSMRKMSALNPQLMELRKKYKGDKQTLNEETMRLYRENGVNPRQERAGRQHPGRPHLRQGAVHRHLACAA